MTDEEEQEGLNDEELKELMNMIEGIFQEVDWDKVAEEEE